MKRNAATISIAMTSSRLTFVLALAVFSATSHADAVADQSPVPLRPDPAHTCQDCAEWNRPLKPFRLFGNTYYVGTDGLSALLVTSSDGHILLDGGLTQSAAIIDANIRALGFRTEDVKLIVNSHAHFDHAGGVAALQRVSGATVAASASSARALASGEPTPDDPQFALGSTFNAFPVVTNVKVLNDREVVKVGPLAMTPHFTPGHTPGSTAWTWQACEGTRCLNMVYADSLTAVSAPAFKYSADPEGVNRFRQSITTVEQLPCDIVVSTHPSFTQLQQKLARRAALPREDPFIDANGCRVYAAEARKRLEQRLAEEAK